MRKQFSEAIERIGSSDKRMVFLTGDLGFMALENVRQTLDERFINMGVSEQNMISLAASLAYEGLIPVCYSIAPFIVFRPAEQIRLDIGLHRMNVKLVGNGGGYGYGIMGATHHALEDLAVISSFQNFRCFIPFCNEDVDGAVEHMFEYSGPSYLRLGYGVLPDGIKIPEFGSLRKIANGDKVTILCLGPVTINVINALNILNESNHADVFVASAMPFLELTNEFSSSLKITKKLMVYEEHVSRGGLGENISSLILKEGINCKLDHHFALGYPNGLYGDQAYHQRLCRLDPDSISIDIVKFSK